MFTPNLNPVYLDNIYKLNINLVNIFMQLVLILSFNISFNNFLIVILFSLYISVKLIFSIYRLGCFLHNLNTLLLIIK